MRLFKSYKQAIDYYYFMLAGRKPWARGYDVYKKKQILATITQGRYNNGQLDEHYGWRLDERIIEYPWLFSVLPAGPGNLLDAGSALNHEFLLNLEPLSSKKIFISTLEYEGRSFCHRGISHVFEDLRQCCYRDDYFDYVVSISTIEHIGLDNTFLYSSDASKKENDTQGYLLAIKEFKRVLKPGKTLYLTFPFGRYKNHGWFQIFDSVMLDLAIQEFSPTQVSETHFRYEPEGWRLSSREESKDCTYFDIHTQKNYDPDFAAASRAIVCVEMVK
jgi:hypothetical protein